MQVADSQPQNCFIVGKKHQKASLFLVTKQTPPPFFFLPTLNFFLPLAQKKKQSTIEQMTQGAWGWGEEGGEGKKEKKAQP